MISQYLDFFEPDFQILSKPYINGNLFIHLQMMHESQFHRIDWFCGLGSHVSVIFTLLCYSSAREAPVVWLSLILDQFSHMSSTQC